MKVALIGRSTMFTVKGGDSIQVTKTAEELNKYGIKTSVLLASDTIPYDEYDLLHFFNIVRPADQLKHIRKSKKPYVISPIYLDYSAFDRHGRSGMAKMIFSLAGKQRSEYIKNVFRFIKNQDKLVSPEYLLGHKRAVKTVLENASFLLPNSQSEFTRLKSDLGYNGNYLIIPNGIDSELFSILPEVTRQDKVICVGQIYGMKNQHLLIESCKNLNYQLDIIGKPPPNHTKYYDYCRKIGSNRVGFIDFLPQKELAKWYASSKVHALPSWFETTGLSSLEAGAMGCNVIVGTGGDTKDYFQFYANYCNPLYPKSIEVALDKAMNEQNTGKLRDLILTEYTWQKAAEKTKTAYEKVLNEK